MNSLTIRHRMLLLALLPALLVAVTLYLYFVSNQLESLSRGLADHGYTLATQLAPASEYPVATGHTELLAQLARSALAARHVSGLAILDRDGQVLLNQGPLTIQSAWLTPQAEVSRCNETPEELTFCATIRRTLLPVDDFEQTQRLHRGEPIGTVILRLSKGEMLALRSSTILETVAITLVVTFFIAWVAVFTGGRIAEPIEAVANTVARVTSGELTHRTAEDGQGELLRLQQGLNQMIDALRSNRDQMQQRIDEATARLRQTLEELEAANRDLRRQRARAEEASRAKSVFLATMSHEIRTPLSGILGLLALLRESQLDAVQRDYLYHLELSARTLRTLLDDILDFSRIEAGRLVLVQEQFSPITVLEDVALLLATTAHEKGLELVCHIAPELPEQVKGDPARLRQVLLNLVGNAIKFTERGRVVIRAQFINDPKAPLGRFEVIDTGPGIPPEKQAVIFDSFTQGDPSNRRRFGGSGLGTTIARELVLLMGGRIGLDSGTGGGTLFWFELPWEGTEPTYPPPMTHLAWVVEADPEARVALIDAARAMGVRAISMSPVEVVNAPPQGEPPALIFLAENGPDPSRDNLAQLLRTRFGPTHPLLVHLRYLTTHNETDLYDQHLVKPVTRAALASCIAQLQRKELPLLPLGESAEPLPGMRVLVAEDDQVNAKVITTFLSRAGFEVVHAENGSQALALLTAEPFDVVLMDVRMPGTDGLEATRCWRAQERHSPGHHLPIIALTANSSDEDVQACRAAGMDDFLAKPVTPLQLFTALERVNIGLRADAAGTTPVRQPAAG